MDVTIVRWGTWLKTAFFYCDNFDKICESIDNLEENSKAIKKAKSLSKSESLKEQLQYVSNFRFFV